MNRASSSNDRRKLGELLIAEGLLGEEQLRAALAAQKEWNEPLGRTLVNMGLLSEELLVRALSRQLGIPACDPATMELPAGIAGHIGLHLVERYGVMPVMADRDRRQLFVATSNPTDRRALAELGDQLGWTVLPVVAAASRIDQAIRKHYFGELPGADSAGTQVPPAQASAQAPAQALESPAAVDGTGAVELGELQRSLADLERLAGGQLRALRVLVEMLVDKGVIRHEEYLARMRGETAGD